MLMKVGGKCSTTLVFRPQNVSYFVCIPWSTALLRCLRPRSCLAKATLTHSHPPSSGLPEQSLELITERPKSDGFSAPKVTDERPNAFNISSLRYKQTLTELSRSFE